MVVLNFAVIPSEFCSRERISSDLLYYVEWDVRPKLYSFSVSQAKKVNVFV